MKSILKAVTSSAAIATAIFAPVHGHAAISNLQDCYAAVISWCDETIRVDCRDIDRLAVCDAEFGETVGGISPYRLVVQGMDDGSYRFHFVEMSPPLFTVDGEGGDTAS